MDPNYPTGENYVLSNSTTCCTLITDMMVITSYSHLCSKDSLWMECHFTEAYLALESSLSLKEKSDLWGALRKTNHEMRLDIRRWRTSAKARLIMMAQYILTRTILRKDYCLKLKYRIIALYYSDVHYFDVFPPLSHLPSSPVFLSWAALSPQGACKQKKSLLRADQTTKCVCDVCVSSGGLRLSAVQGRKNIKRAPAAYSRGTAESHDAFMVYVPNPL